MAVIAISIMPSVGAADSIQNFFSSTGDQCGRHTYIVEWNVSGDTDGDIIIERFLRRESRERSSFEGLTWQFPATDLSASVTASDANGRPLYMFTDMLSNSPSVVVLDRRGDPRTDCSFALEVALHPSERFEATITALNTPNPTAEDGRLVNDSLAHLPPAAMLSTLSQTSTEREVQNAINPFWDRYEATVLARASNADDTEVLSETVGLWGEQNTNSQSRFHGNLLLRAQDIRARTMRQQGEDPSQLAVDDMNALCARVDGFNIRWEWDEYLELATGLPLEYWNEARAENFLNSSASCENAETFQNVVSRRWPDVQARITAFSEVIAERDRIAGLDITLEVIVSENWLNLDRNRLNEWRRLGISQDDVLDVVSPALEAQRQAAIAQLPIALGNEARTQNIELGEISSWCDQRRREIGYAYNNDLQDAVFEGCHAQLAELLRAQAFEAIEMRKTELLSAPQNLETLISTNGYSFDNTIPRLRSNSPDFEVVIVEINAALSSAQQETEARYQAVLDSTMESINAAFASADPMGESAEAATEMCAPLTGFGTPRRLQPIRNLCQNLINDLQVRRSEAECDATWSNMEAPEDIQRGYLNVPQILGGSSQVSVRALVCNSGRAGVNVWIEEDGGWFSSDFRLYREAMVQDRTVEISARLNAPEAGSVEWTVDDLAISSGVLGLNETATSEEIMGCFYYPETCYRP